MPAIPFSLMERRIITWGNNGENVVLAAAEACEALAAPDAVISLT